MLALVHYSLVWSGHTIELRIYALPRRVKGLMVGARHVDSVFILVASVTIILSVACAVSAPGDEVPVSRRRTVRSI